MTHKIKPNTFKSGLAERREQIGIWSSLCSPVAAELLAGAGYDWILFDTEHSPIDIEGVLPLLQAAAAHQTHPIVRVAWNDKVLIKRALDIGAQSLLLPFVQNATEAAEAVAAAKYPPTGIRGLAGATRASNFGRITDYATTANDEICVVVQIETLEAYENIEEIAAVPGVDALFIGPSDFSASLGHTGNILHPDVQEYLRAAPGKINAAGKPAGILGTNPTNARQYFDWGYSFVSAGLDAPMLVAAVDTALVETRRTKS